ncbi:MAG: UDP-glucose 4-epimerase GalE [Candidatus Aminicenantes bacterium]|nr:UDP-glucose 4-epimerase GalE [Candidatus Aminicenantes bacterium]
MTVLVSGGAGYIGSHTTKSLIKHGFDPIILDNFSSGKKQLVPQGTSQIIEKDLKDKKGILEIFQKHEIKAVLHFASLIQVGESYTDPHQYYSANLINSLNLLEAMLKTEVKYFIFSSSAAVYGTPNQIPISESHSVNPVNPYGRTKLMIEEILKDYQRAYGLQFVSLRYFNAAGADPDTELGEMHDPETHLIPNVLLSLLDRNRKLEIFGTDFPTKDGTAIRDYIHVTDLAEAHVLALKYLKKHHQSEFINLGTNQGYSVKEILTRTEHTTGKKVPYTEKPRRKGDVAVLVASHAKAQDLLGWELNYSDIDIILQTAWSWHKKTANA